MTTDGHYPPMKLHIHKLRIVPGTQEMLCECGFRHGEVVNLSPEAHAGRGTVNEYPMKHTPIAMCAFCGDDATLKASDNTPLCENCATMYSPQKGINLGTCSVCRRPQIGKYHEHPCE